jgi:hypothetical protein
MTDRLVVISQRMINKALIKMYQYTILPYICVRTCSIGRAGDALSSHAAEPGRAAAAKSRTPVLATDLVAAVRGAGLHTGSAAWEDFVRALHLSFVANIFCTAVTIIAGALVCTSISTEKLEYT